MTPGGRSWAGFGGMVRGEGCGVLMILFLLFLHANTIGLFAQLLKVSLYRLIEHRGLLRLAGTS